MLQAKTEKQQEHILAILEKNNHGCVIDQDENGLYLDDFITYEEMAAIVDYLREPKDKEETDELKKQFAAFVSEYKKAGGKVRGVDTEFRDFTKRHKDWQSIIPYLPTALQREVKERNQAKADGRFFPEMKMLQTYLGKQRAWELYVSVGEDISQKEYSPICGGMLNWNEYYKCYMYTGIWYGGVVDGYNDENRPDGATIVLNNARGKMIWNSISKEWIKG